MGIFVYHNELLPEIYRLAPADWQISTYTPGLRSNPKQVSSHAGNQCMLRHRRILIPRAVLDKVFDSVPFMDARMVYGNYDVIHDFTADMLPNRVSRLISTIHDICILRTDVESYSEEVRCQTRARLERTINLSEAIITISDFSKSEIVNLLGADPRKIHVIPNGVNRISYYPAGEDDCGSVKSVLQELGIDRP